MMAYALERNGVGKLYSIDAEQAYASKTTALLQAHGLSHRAEVIVAPLERLTLSGWGGDWYRIHAFEPIVDATVDLLVIDGPPKETAPRARYPAVPMLHAKLKPGATIVLDDAGRPDEKLILQSWIEAGFLSRRPEVFPFGSGFAVGTAALTK